MEELQDVFGTRLKRFMQEKNMTQRKLAKATGLTDVTISRYTNGTRLPGADELLKLSNALSVSADDLIGIGKAGETRVSTRATSCSISSGRGSSIPGRCTCTGSLHSGNIQKRKKRKSFIRLCMRTLILVYISGYMSGRLTCFSRR